MLQGLLVVGILGELAHLLKDLCGPLGALSHIAKQVYEDFLGILGCHDSFSF